MKSATVKVKICGLTNLEDALAAAFYGADALGFIFAPSPRQVTVEAVRDIVAELPPFVTKVGVFTNSGLSEVKEIMSFCSLDMVQLHGEETPEFCALLFPKVIKTFKPSNLPSLSELKHYKASAFLIDRDKGTDTRPEGIWSVAGKIGNCGRVILAGGLSPENVARAIKSVQPYAVDVAGGVEREPGKKEPDKIRAFIQAAKGDEGEN